MGTKVHSETLSPGGYHHHHSMRDLNNDSNGCSRLPLLNSDNNNNRTSANDHQSYKDVVRRTMLEHEAVFKSQILELHRVYGIQKDMMDELKRKQFNKELFPLEASCSSQAEATPNDDDLRKWKLPIFPSMSVVEDNGHSPMKGVVHSGQVPWLNGANSQNVETLEVRPTKIRKKMIDLCLPADDDYIDDNEEVVELKNHRYPNGAEPRGDSLRVGYGSSSRNTGLADLNEPFKAQESNEVAFQSHVRDYGKVLNSGSVREHVPVISLHPDVNGKPKDWPHQPLRIDKSAASFLQPGKPLDDSSSRHMQMNSSQRVMGSPNAGPPSKADFWRGKTFIDLEADTNSSHEVIHDSSFASHQPRHLYPCNPPDSAVPWNRLHSSWQNPSFVFPQRVASAQRYNLSDTNAQKLGGVGDRLQFESNARYNSGCGSSTTRSNHNMFYNDCSSSSSLKSKLSGSGYNYPNGGRSDHSLLDLNGSEVKKSAVRDLNLNVTLSNTSVVEVRKDEEHLATLPWLVKPKPASDGRWNLNSDDDVPSSSLKPSNIIKEEGGNSVQNLMWLERLKSGSCSSKPETEKINAERDKVRMMLDINEPLSDEEDQQTEEQTRTKASVSNNNNCNFDLNMSVSEDEDESWSAPTSSKLNSKRPMIDLETVPESDVEEDDVSGEKPSEETPTLEKPPEFEKIAAETIVAISSACLDRELEAVASSPETAILHWFAETVDTHRENLDQKLASLSSNQARSIEEIDYFESMTLQLPDIREEEYMPTPLLPEDLMLEETSVATSHQRPRRGNARKAKQRRDFQRDILPGLLSLSKHEVTEDIHMFDGLVRATGSSWTPTGLTRKKTGARGRPRRVVTNPEPVVYYPVQAPPCPPSVQQHVGNNGEIEMGFEDESFGGWGKMTRRPRRQRCPSSSVTTSTVANVHHHTRMSRDGWE